MNSFATLFFPETTIFSDKRYPLLLFFTPLHFVQVVEAAPGPLPDAEARLFLERGLCQAHTPAPLGNDREPFLRLIEGIAERNESLAGNELQTGTAGIVSSLLRQYGVKQPTSEKELLLWQSRLLLAIAEIFDSQEEDLREELSSFNEDEIDAFRSLPGAVDPNEDDPFREGDKIITQLGNAHLAGMGKRFAAWLRLLQNHPLPPVQVWLAATRGSAKQIFDRYTSSSNAHAIPLYKLALPAQIAASGKYAVERIEEFQEATRAIHQGIVADFQRSTTAPYLGDVYESLLPYGTDWAEQWQGALADFFPAKNDGRQDVTFYLFPNQPLGRLLSMPSGPDRAHGEPAHGLLAVLGPPQTS